VILRELELPSIRTQEYLGANRLLRPMAPVILFESFNHVTNFMVM